MAKKARNATLDYLQYVALRVVAMLFLCFPVNTNLKTAKLLGTLLYRFDRKHRERALANLRRSFPEKSDRELQTIAERSMQALAAGQAAPEFRRLFETPALSRFIDFGVAGEGERAVVGLANALQRGGGFDQVPNLYWFEQGEVRKSPLPPDVPDLNDFPAPDFRGIRFDDYLSPSRIANLQTSRGCYYGKCTFCGDGFRRNLTNRFEVVVDGRRVPGAGTVSMDNITVDLGDTPVQRGTEAVVIGQGILAEDLARALGTINYEITCGITQRVPREYV